MLMSGGVLTRVWQAYRLNDVERRLVGEYHIQHEHGGSEFLSFHPNRLADGWCEPPVNTTIGGWGSRYNWRVNRHTLTLSNQYNTDRLARFLRLGTPIGVNRLLITRLDGRGLELQRPNGETLTFHRVAASDMRFDRIRKYLQHDPPLVLTETAATD